MNRLRLVFSAAAVLASGCILGPTANATSRATTPAGCDTAAMRTLVHAFVGDFNTGHLHLIVWSM